MMANSAEWMFLFSYFYFKRNNFFLKKMLFKKKAHFSNIFSQKFVMLFEIPYFW